MNKMSPEISAPEQLERHDDSFLMLIRNTSSHCTVLSRHQLLVPKEYTASQLLNEVERIFKYEPKTLSLIYQTLESGGSCVSIYIWNFKTV